MTGPLLHAFGARYDLPAPLVLYLFAGAAVVVLSFVLIALFAGEAVGDRAIRYPRRRARWFDPLAASSIPRAVGGAVGLAVLVAIVAIGLFGPQRATSNAAEFLLWIYFWAGLVLITGIVGNLWTLLNPWSALYAVTAGRSGWKPPLKLPGWLGIWPAVAVYFLFVCLELASGLAPDPTVIGALSLAYAAVMYIGMLLYGEEWLRRCDAFTVLFGVVAMFGPLEIDAECRVWLRPWGVGLLGPWPPGWDRVVFVILMLASLAFDGLLATPVYRFYNLLLPAQVPAALNKTLALLVLAGVFLGAFLLTMRLVMWLGWPQLTSPLAAYRGVPVGQALSAFALTLVPIALVYNAAHNYTYLVVQSQALLPLLADPFGRGWNLLPTAGYKPSFALAGAAVVWYAQVVLIVLGHIIAVYLAHLRAGQRFRDSARALISQYPMLLLMVCYTATSLWILAQPITREA